MSEGLGRCMDWWYYSKQEIEDIDGYVCLGTDRFYEDFDRLVKEGFIDPDFQFEKSDTPTKKKKKERVIPTSYPTLRDGLTALAAMIADRKKQFKDDFIKAYGEKRYKALSDEERYFWTTVYYNSGPGNGRKELLNSGLNGAKKFYATKFGKFKRDIQSNNYARYNAKLRTATYEYVKNACIFRPECLNNQALFSSNR